MFLEEEYEGILLWCVAIWDTGYDGFWASHQPVLPLYKAGRHYTNLGSYRRYVV